MRNVCSVMLFICVCLRYFYDIFVQIVVRYIKTLLRHNEPNYLLCFVFLIHPAEIKPHRNTDLGRFIIRSN